MLVNIAAIYVSVTRERDIPALFVFSLVQTGPIASVKNTLRHRLTGDVYAGDAIGISL